MKPHEFVVLVKKMRAAQKAYFARREPERLEASKALEREVDAAVKSLESPSLFDSGASEEKYPDPLDRRVVVVFDPAPEGGYVVHSPTIPAVHTEGDTLLEAATMFAFAVKDLAEAARPEAA